MSVSLIHASLTAYDFCMFNRFLTPRESSGKFNVTTIKSMYHPLRLLIEICKKVHGKNQQLYCNLWLFFLRY